MLVHEKRCGGENGISPLARVLWGRARSVVQPLPPPIEPFWVSPPLQDSDGDKSDYNLVVDEVSPQPSWRADTLQGVQLEL